MLYHQQGIDKETYDLVMLAFKHKGWVAGGFARRLLHDLRFPPLVDSSPGDQRWNFHIAQRTKLYLGDRKIQKDPVRNTQGDIDLFFESTDDLWRFKLEFAELSFSIGSPYVNAWTTNIVVPKVYIEFVVNDTTRVQVVENHVGSIDDILNGFDIFNAAVAFNDQFFVSPEGWEELEQAGMLHVFNYKSPMIINRVAKWYGKHNLYKLSPQTADNLGSIALDVIKKLKDHPYEFATGDTLNVDLVIEKLRQLLPMLSTEQLLLLSTVFSLDSKESYSELPGVMTILRRRFKTA
jgi:hypothetical protein